MESPLYLYAVCSVALFFKMFFLSLYQGYYRVGQRKYVIPEDARVFTGGSPEAEDLPAVQRAQSAWRNDVENIPIFFGLGVVYVMVDASPAAAGYLFVGFTVARIVHSLVFLAGLQPWRTLAYSVAIACLIGMSVNILRAVT